MSCCDGRAKRRRQFAGRGAPRSTSPALVFDLLPPAGGSRTGDRRDEVERSHGYGARQVSRAGAGDDLVDDGEGRVDLRRRPCGLRVAGQPVGAFLQVAVREAGHRGQGLDGEPVLALRGEDGTGVDSREGVVLRLGGKVCQGDSEIARRRDRVQSKEDRGRVDVRAAQLPASRRRQPVEHPDAKGRWQRGR